MTQLKDLWTHRHEECGAFVSYWSLLCFLFTALLTVTILNYILSLTAVVLFFVFYTKPDGCFINKFFISFNMLLCIVASVISVLHKVQVHNRADLLCPSQLIFPDVFPDTARCILAFCFMSAL